MRRRTKALPTIPVPVDDGRTDFDEDAKTSLDGVPLPDLDPQPEEVFAEPITAPHRPTEFLAGREAGFSEGLNAAISALVDELRRAGVPEAEIPLITVRVREGAEKRG